MSDPLFQPARFDDRTAFQAWAERQGGRWERHAGQVVRAMAPERVNHSRIKAATWAALADALRRVGLPYEAFVDGPTVTVDADSDYVPDVVVSCGERVDGLGMTVPTPCIVIEVLSPSTAAVDTGTKLADYFRLPSVQHYLVFAADAVRVTHHRRWTEGQLLTTLHFGGTIPLDPPGIEIAIDDCYRGTGLPSSPSG